MNTHALFIATTYCLEYGWLSARHVNKSNLRLSSAFQVSLRRAERERNSALDGRRSVIPGFLYIKIAKYINTARLNVH